MRTILKNSIILFFILSVSALQAQDSLKMFNNNWSTELNFNPFNGNLSFNNATGQVKLRYFKPNGKALRLGVNLNFNRNNSNAEAVYGTNPYNNKTTQKSFMIGVNVGRENHFSGTRRLSPYVGWELGVGFKSSYQEVKTDTKTTETKGAWITYTQVQNSQQFYTYQTFTERGYWSVGANLVTGFDFYISPKFYFGYELLFGLDYISYSDIDITEKFSGSNSNPNQNPDLDDESWKFGPKLINGIRIGYFF